MYEVGSKNNSVSVLVQCLCRIYFYVWPSKEMPINSCSFKSLPTVLAHIGSVCKFVKKMCHSSKPKLPSRWKLLDALYMLNILSLVKICPFITKISSQNNPGKNFQLDPCSYYYITIIFHLLSQSRQARIYQN